MAQEFTINSTAIEDKINQLLPSQGGMGAGIDFSASTMVIPVVNLTEAAEGSNIRQDLQTSLSHTSITSFAVVNTTTTLITTTGYFRVFGVMSTLNTPNTAACSLIISDGTTDKIIVDGRVDVQYTNAASAGQLPFDFVVFLGAGDSLKASSGDVKVGLRGCTRQIADISGNLTNP